MSSNRNHLQSICRSNSLCRRIYTDPMPLHSERWYSQSVWFCLASRFVGWMQLLLTIESSSRWIPKKTSHCLQSG